MIDYVMFLSFMNVNQDYNSQILFHFNHKKKYIYIYLSQTPGIEELMFLTYMGWASNWIRFFNIGSYWP